MGFIRNPLIFLARSERFERPTYRFVACCSIQLSYERVMVYLIKPQSFVKLFVDCLIHMVKTLKSANIKMKKGTFKTEITPAEKGSVSHNSIFIIKRIIGLTRNFNPTKQQSQF